MDPIYTKMASMMQDEAIIYSRPTVDKYNRPTLSGDSYTYQGRAIYGEEKTVDVQGVEVLYVGKFITYGPISTNITVDDKLEINGGEPFVVKNVSPITDDNGAHHAVIRFGH